MKRRAVLLLKLTAVLLPLLFTAAAPPKPGAWRAPRTPDGKPDLQGIWEVRNTAGGNLEAHSASLGIRAGESVIIDPPDGKIPYQAAAAARQKENFKNRMAQDPLNKCFLPGVP